MQKKAITLQEFKALCNETADQVIEYQFAIMRKLIPESHFSGAIRYIMSSYAAKIICYLCENDMEARKAICADLCEVLPKIVQDAIVLEKYQISKEKH